MDLINFGLVILALLLFVLHAVAARSAIVWGEGPEIVKILGDTGVESDTDNP